MTADIVITNFNRRDKVVHAIDSALMAAKFFSGKVIVVDDASTDESGSFLLQQYKEALNSNKIELIKHDVNQGVTGAKNTGFITSNADWVIFLDSDDQLLQTSYNDILNTLQHYDSSPIIFFRVQDQDGKIVGQYFQNEQALNLKRYLEHTSYGEALVAIKRSLITHRPYDADLRGYEGIGCMRIIRDYGNAILSPIVARRYNRNDNDRLSSPSNFIARSHLLAKGHFRVLKEFKAHLSFKMRALLFAKALIYASMSTLNYKKK